MMNQDELKAICANLLEATEEPLRTLRDLVVRAVGTREIGGIRRSLMNQVKDYYQVLFDATADAKKTGTVCACAGGTRGNKCVCMCTVNDESETGVRHGLP